MFGLWFKDFFSTLLCLNIQRFLEQKSYKELQDFIQKMNKERKKTEKIERQKKKKEWMKILR